MLAGELAAIELINTSDCNLDCTYCFRRRPVPARMVRKVAAAAVDLVLQSRAPRVDVSVTGGEPLSEVDRLRWIVERISRLGRGATTYRISVTTNGTLIDADVLDLLIRHDVDLHVSLDGDRRVQSLRAPRTFDRIQRTLRMIRDDAPEYFRDRVHVHSVVTAANVSYLAGSARYFLGMGIEDIRFGPVMTEDAAWDERTERVLDRQCHQIVEISEHHVRRARTVPVHFLAARSAGTRRRCNLACGALLPDSLCVDVDGEAYGCHVFARSHGAFHGSRWEADLESSRFGSVLDPAFPTHLHEKDGKSVPRIFRSGERQFSTRGDCSTCGDAEDCPACPAATALIPGNTDPHRVPDAICSFHRVTSKHGREFRRRLNLPYEAARALWPERFAR